MKPYFVFFISIAIITLLNSCLWAGSDSRQGVSSQDNDTAFLFTKKSTDFDWKFGYESLVYKREDSLRFSCEHVFIPKQIWDKIPNLTNSISVKIFYLRKIEYGRNGGSGISLWDKRFNLCINFEIDTLKM